MQLTSFKLLSGRALCHSHILCHFSGSVTRLRLRNCRCLKTTEWGLSWELYLVINLHALVLLAAQSASCAAFTGPWHRFTSPVINWLLSEACRESMEILILSSCLVTSSEWWDCWLMWAPWAGTFQMRPGIVWWETNSHLEHLIFFPKVELQIRWIFFFCQIILPPATQSWSGTDGGWMIAVELFSNLKQKK